jgi:hypothetical protein
VAADRLLIDAAQVMELFGAVAVAWREAVAERGRRAIDLLAGPVDMPQRVRILPRGAVRLPRLVERVEDADKRLTVLLGRRSTSHTASVPAGLPYSALPADAEADRGVQLDAVRRDAGLPWISSKKPTPVIVAAWPRRSVHALNDG